MIGYATETPIKTCNTSLAVASLRSRGPIDNILLGALSGLSQIIVCLSEYYECSEECK